MALLLLSTPPPPPPTPFSTPSLTTKRPFLSPHSIPTPTPTHRRRRTTTRILSPLRVAAPPSPTTTSPEDQQQSKPEQQSPNFEVQDEDEDETLSSKFSWRDHWYPVSLIEDLDPNLPTPFQLLNRDLVLWFDRSISEWVAFDDKCPHRLAPLSEGRIDENGHLQCSYHGWSFDGCGSCVQIPQASPEGPEARALKSPRACATRFPTMVSQGLLFIWPDENGLERARATNPPMLPDDFENPEFSTVTIQRDLFYGYDTLMENVSDPSHIDFAHHKVTGRRDRAKPLPFKMESTGHWGFEGSNDGNPKISAKFVAPCYYINKIEIDTKLPIVGDQKWVIWICSFNVPMAPGKTRSIVCSARNFFQFTMPGPAWWQVIPRWHEHWTSNKVYDGDMIVLQGQEKVFLSKSMEYSADVNKQYTKITFTPTQADRLVLAFRNWLRRHGKSQPEWFGITNNQPLPSIVLSKTDTLLLEFPLQSPMTNVYIRNHAKAAVPLLWSLVQVQGQISLLCGGVLSFGLAHYAMSEFELLAEELLMSESTIKVYGALRMSVKIFLMWNSTMLIDGGGDANVESSLLEASNLVVLKESSVISSNANLGVHGQGVLNLSGPGDCIEAQRLVLSLFYSVQVGPGSVLRGPVKNPSADAVIPRLNCGRECPIELFHPPEDCSVNSTLSFTLQICRVEDILVEGLIEGSVIHFHRARTIAVPSSGTISASGMGCKGGVGRGNVLSNGLGSGGGHGGKGGSGCYNGSYIDGGISYGDADLPCELGSGSGNDSLARSTAGGGIIVMGSWEQSLSSLFVEGSVTADGGSFGDEFGKKDHLIIDDLDGGPGGGSGGTILLFLHTLTVGASGILSSIGGVGGPQGGGGGGGGRIHFHWSNIPTGDVYQPLASVEGSINSSGGLGRDQGGAGENGTLTGKACPKGLYGTFCEECPAGTYKNVTGSDRDLCHHCPAYELPHRAVYITIRGGVTETPCPYLCISDSYRMPHCYTALEELIYTFGGPWLFGLLLLGLLILLALVLSVARMKFVGVDELPGPAPTHQGSQIDHSFPFLESLNEVLETSRVEESQSHVHRMYFMGPNTFSDPWHLPHTPPEQVKQIVYEGPFNTFVDEINAIAAYHWWEGSVYSILSILAYPLAWSWQQWRRRIKLQLLREFVRSEYDHACLQSCRSRALYEGIKVAATADLMLAYVDFFLGGDETRTDLPSHLRQRFPMSLLLGGDGSYMAPFSLHSDNIITSLASQSVPPTTWYRFVAGLNAQLRLVRRGCLRSTFRPVLKWIETCANPALRIHGVCVDLAWFQATTSGYCQYGLLVYAVEEETECTSFDSSNGAIRAELHSCENLLSRKKANGAILDTNNLKMLKEKRDIFYPLSFIIRNTKPVGHQDLVGLVISMLLLGDFSLLLLTLLQLYSISLASVFLVLFVLPLGILLPFPTGINALFSHGPKRSAALTRVYALWNITSLINVVVAFICGFVHYKTQSSRKLPGSPPWNMDESEWWMFPVGLLLCKCMQSQIINWHIANLEIQDRSLYSSDFELFWQS